ncbi:MAG: hypothetical protein KKA65_04705, partial [Nanoarchaeota archaeon]|nr:hypothetical protein [Nanoarchaeota archaeon]MCG2720165.1 hypothetical protein [Nanoarchaeota archaeon]
MSWNSDIPIKELPRNIRTFFLKEANYLFKDLKNNKLVVILVNAPEPKHCGHKIRVVDCQNPCWYSELYHSIDYFRRDRSLRALERITQLNDGSFRCSPYKYDAIYRQLIFQRLVEGHEAENFEIPP